MTKKATHYAETKYGFEYGAASIERTWSHNGYVCLTVRTKAGKAVDIVVTPSGQKITVTERSLKR